MEEIWDKIKIWLIQLTHFQKRNRLKRYGFPIILTIFIFLTKHYFHNLLGDSSAFLLASFVVAASAWYGGFGPSLFATLLTAVTTYYMYLSQDIIYHSFLGDLLLVAIFTLEGIIISITSEARYEMENQKDEFIGFVSHELKNPLATVKGFAGLIINNAKNSGNDKLLSYGKEINNQSNKILELINDLLDITKIEIGKFTYTSSLFDMDDLVKEVIVHQGLVTRERAIELRGTTKSVISADRYRIKQVIVNLLTNSLKYSPVTKKVIIKLKKNKDSIDVSVQDYGIGIPQEEQKRIFDRFYRTKDVRKNRSEGLGLGLYITSQIIKQHHGRLWVDSKPGKGSTFTFTLPLKTR